MKLKLLDGQPEEFPYVIIGNQTKQAVARVNEALHRLGTEYHDGLPLKRISEILSSNGFSSEALEGIYCGREGDATEQVGTVGKRGRELYLHMHWHKMESGRFEVVAYVN